MCVNNMLIQSDLVILPQQITIFVCNMSKKYISIIAYLSCNCVRVGSERITTTMEVNVFQHCT